MSKVTIDVNKLKGIIETELFEMRMFGGRCVDSRVGIGEIDGFQLVLQVIPSDGRDAFPAIDKHRCIDKVVPVVPPKPTTVTPDGHKWKVKQLGSVTGVARITLPDKSVYEAREPGFVIVTRQSKVLTGSSTRVVRAKFLQHSEMTSAGDYIEATYEVRPSTVKAKARRR